MPFCLAARGAHLRVQLRALSFPAVLSPLPTFFLLADLHLPLYWFPIFAIHYLCAHFCRDSFPQTNPFCFRFADLVVPEVSSISLIPLSEMPLAKPARGALQRRLPSGPC